MHGIERTSSMQDSDSHSSWPLKTLVSTKATHTVTNPETMHVQGFTVVFSHFSGSEQVENRSCFFSGFIESRQEAESGKCDFNSSCLANLHWLTKLLPQTWCQIGNIIFAPLGRPCVRSSLELSLPVFCEHARWHASTVESCVTLGRRQSSCKNPS